MSVHTSRELRVYGAVTGYQEHLRGTLISNVGALTMSDVSGSAKGPVQDLTGATLATGTFYFFAATAGCSAVDLTFTATITGTAPTITVGPTLSDNITIKGTATAVTALVSGTQATTSLTGLRGERGVLVKMVVPGASTALFTVAEYSAL